MKNRSIIFSALLFVGCQSAPKRHDTATLTAKLGSAKGSVEAAQRSTAALAGHVGTARSISSRLDGKSAVILRWMEK